MKYSVALNLLIGIVLNTLPAMAQMHESFKTANGQLSVEYGESAHGVSIKITKRTDLPAYHDAWVITRSNVYFRKADENNPKAYVGLESEDETHFPDMKFDPKTDIDRTSAVLGELKSDVSVEEQILEWQVVKQILPKSDWNEVAAAIEKQSSNQALKIKRQ
jgi:hypothetical protein